MEFCVSTLLHLFLGVSLIIRHCLGYYDTIACYGTGDCILQLAAGGHADDQHKWNSECHDGEGIIGLNGGGDYQGFGTIWCRFLFPKKAPTFGLYPYYDYCNLRDISLREFYCYDKLYPVDTYDTFATAVSSSQYYPGGLSVSSSYKCCRLPLGYHFDYRLCEYKYTHDRWGEHYGGPAWIVKCDRNYLVTGFGQGHNPWTNALHYTWVQCCPFFYDLAFQIPHPPSNRTVTRGSPYCYGGTNCDIPKQDSSSSSTDSPPDAGNATDAPAK
ncbi:hypothetical protein BV898_16932 [Hypsibius exemplaris]|uniref:Uncharacterized protein n=1 Tax=Hypsibius exemplaris TaxID=2072580 RepID=A0A9X6NMS5_HYPEX|nr:hypothetical protein BV898_16932 [Hypsibius exemplaris]